MQSRFIILIEILIQIIFSEYVTFPLIAVAVKKAVPTQIKHHQYPECSLSTPADSNELRPSLNGTGHNSVSVPSVIASFFIRVRILLLLPCPLNQHNCDLDMQRQTDSGSTKLANFRREIEVLGKLRHPNITTIIGAGCMCR
jgi:hypothetical protein